MFRLTNDAGPNWYFDLISRAILDYKTNDITYNIVRNYFRIKSKKKIVILINI